MSKNLDQLRRFMQMELIAGIRIQRWENELRKNFASVAQKRGRYLIYAGNEAITDAVYERDTMFLEGIYDDCIGITKLKSTDQYKFLKAVEQDRVTEVIDKLDTTPAIKQQDNSFFKFYGRDDRVYFLNPAHLARSPQMVSTLATRHFDFNAPDSDGRLPLFFIARHAQSRWTIPALCQIFNVNANNSGKIPAHIPLPAILVDDEPETPLSNNLARQLDKVEKSDSKIIAHISDDPIPPVWDPPLIRAIKYRNRETLLGMDILPPHTVNWNIRFQYNRMTPLIYAVLQADEAVKSHRQWHDDAKTISNMAEWPRQDFSRYEVSKALWMVKFLAAHKHVDPALTDNTGMDAAGYAYTDSVKKALNEGLKARKNHEKLFTSLPKRRFT